jgi:hypothetical protein
VIPPFNEWVNAQDLADTRIRKTAIELLERALETKTHLDNVLGTEWAYNFLRPYDTSTYETAPARLARQTYHWLLFDSEEYKQRKWPKAPHDRFYELAIAKLKEVR